LTALLTLVNADIEVMSPFAPLAAAPKLLSAPGAVLAPVPPFAIGTMPVSEMFGVAPPLEANGDEAVTVVTVPAFGVVNPSVTVLLFMAVAVST
jgi:hypothetical protein